MAHTVLYIPTQAVALLTGSGLSRKREGQGQHGGYSEECREGAVCLLVEVCGGAAGFLAIET